jgi:hypothetical protein
LSTFPFAAAGKASIMIVSVAGTRANVVPAKAGTQVVSVAGTRAN